MEKKRIESWYVVALAAIFILAIVGIIGYIFAIDLSIPLFGSVYVILQVAIFSLVIFIIIKSMKRVGKYLDAITEKPNEIRDLRETLTQMRLSIDEIGKKVDNIEKILENVSE